MIDRNLLDGLLQQAAENPRKRMNYDMRTSPEDGSQRMLNAILPGSVVPIHRHPISSENMILISGKLEVVMYEEVTDLRIPGITEGRKDGSTDSGNHGITESRNDGNDGITDSGSDGNMDGENEGTRMKVAKRTLKEVGRFHLCIAEGCYGCQVPKGVWHTVQVIEPSVIYEAKDGKYGEDGSETYGG